MSGNFHEIPSVERRIRLLPEAVFNRIAAGEVVERPASVLKELVENALDAGATQIDVSLSGAGQKEICVSDNGEGMGREDLVLAFQRHATSKVATVEDLTAIHTLGFRGEALSAIASVGRVEATSRVRPAGQGYRLRLLGGKLLGIEEVGAAEGTTITVSDLFFNTPARRKFLKSAAVESGHLIATFKRYALAYPQVRWALDVERKEAYRLPPESLLNRLPAVFSEELVGKVFPVHSRADDIKVSGFVGAPGLARRSRGEQHLIINQRWVQNRLLGHAVAAAYGPLLGQGLFPFYVLLLDVASADVDVNVHPAKTEVKLRHENEIYAILNRAVGDALQQAGLSATSALNLRLGEKLNSATGEIQKDTSLFQSFRAGPPQTLASAEAYQLMFRSPPAIPLSQSESESGNAQTDEADSRYDAPQAVSERTQIYQIHQRYILTEIKGGLAIIDQHAAHERVLYERALKALSGGKMPSQQVLFPRVIELDVENALRLKEVIEDLQALGIGVREFGERSFILESLPSGLASISDEQIIKEILDELRERGGTGRPGIEQVAAAFACRAAIKFGQTLTLAEMNGLIDQLFASRFPFSCPHGRPTLLQLSLGELERRFGRS